MKTKRLLFTLLLTLALVLLFTVSAGAAYILGDVDNDGSVTASDARLALRRAVLLEDFAAGSDAFVAADTDFDGQVTASDARMILRAAVGLEKLGKKGKLSSSEIYKLASKFTYEITAENDEYISTGSGFSISTDGVIVTNYHVIDGMYEITATDYTGNEFPVAQVLAFDEELDLAVLKINAVTVAAELNRDDYETGDKIYSLGSSLSLTGTFADGMISHKARRLEGERVVYIQHSAPISHGNSGGPLLDEYGRVLGVNTASFTEGQNLNLAIPITYLDELDYSNPLTVSEFYQRINPSFDSLVNFVSNDKYDFDLIEVTNPKNGTVNLTFRFTNRTNNTLGFRLSDFEINNVMIHVVSVRGNYSVQDIIVNPNQSTLVEYSLSDYLTPPGFSIFPIGQCHFSYQVYKMILTTSGWGKEACVADEYNGFFNKNNKDQMLWYPSYGNDFYDIWNSVFRFGFYYSRCSTLDVTNDTLQTCFFFQNLSDHKLSICFNITAINNYSFMDIVGREPSESFYVYPGCSVEPYFYLFYDFTGESNYAFPLNRIGIRPADVYRIDYTLTVYDCYTNTYVYMDNWYISR